ncbi:MAG: hypothetical protein EOO65_03165, partial [Methanosarcinales archaeon]
MRALTKALAQCTFHPLRLTPALVRARAGQAYAWAQAALAYSPGKTYFAEDEWSEQSHIFVNRDWDAAAAYQVYFHNQSTALKEWKPRLLVLPQSSGTGKTSFAKRLSYLLRRHRGAAVEWEVLQHTFPGAAGKASIEHMESTNALRIGAKWIARHTPETNDVSPKQVHEMLDALSRAVVLYVDCSVEGHTSSSATAPSERLLPSTELYYRVAKMLGVDVPSARVDDSAFITLMEHVAATCMAQAEPQAVILIIDEYIEMLNEHRTLATDRYDNLMKLLRSLVQVRGLFPLLVGADGDHFERWVDQPGTSATIQKVVLPLNSLSAKDTLAFLYAAARVELSKAEGTGMWSRLAPQPPCGGSTPSASAGGGASAAECFSCAAVSLDVTRLSHKDVEVLANVLHSMTAGHARLLKRLWIIVSAYLNDDPRWSCADIVRDIQRVALNKPLAKHPKDITSGEALKISDELLGKIAEHLSGGSGLDVVNAAEKVALALLRADAVCSNVVDSSVFLGKKKCNLWTLCVCTGIPLSPTALPSKEGVPARKLSLPYPMWKSCWDLVDKMTSELNEMVVKPVLDVWSNRDADASVKGRHFEDACVAAMALSLSATFQPENTDVIDAVRALPFLANAKKLLQVSDVGFHLSSFGVVRALRVHEVA